MTTDKTRLTCIQILSQMQVTAIRPVTFLMVRLVTLLQASEVLKNTRAGFAQAHKSDQGKMSLASMSVMRLMLARLWSYEDSEMAYTAMVVT